MRKSIGLKTFLQGSTNPIDRMPGCANFRDGLCWDIPCGVLNGKQCGYFEKSVLPTAVELGQQDRINDLYRKQTGIVDRFAFEEKIGRPTRSCPDCGGVVLPRMRYCETCKRKRRQTTYRQKRDNQRHLCATVK